MADETPLRERIMYKRSPAHIKTLDILAKSTHFAAQSASNLQKYCALARSAGGASNASQAGEFLQGRYGWEAASRLADLQEAWRASSAPLAPEKEKKKEKEEEEEEGVVNQEQKQEGAEAGTAAVAPAVASSSSSSGSRAGKKLAGSVVHPDRVSE
jgi:hypothetical protein